MDRIGLLIRKKLKERGKTVVWFSKELACSRTNVYKIFEKSAIATDDLFRISKILDYNFFKLFADEFDKK